MTPRTARVVVRTRLAVEADEEIRRLQLPERGAVAARRCRSRTPVERDRHLVAERPQRDVGGDLLRLRHLVQVGLLLLRPRSSRTGGSPWPGRATRPCGATGRAARTASPCARTRPRSRSRRRCRSGLQPVLRHATRAARPGAPCRAGRCTGWTGASQSAGDHDREQQEPGADAACPGVRCTQHRTRIVRVGAGAAGALEQAAREPAVDRDHGAGDVRGAVGGEEADDVGDLPAGRRSGAAGSPSCRRRASGSRRPRRAAAVSILPGAIVFTVIFFGPASRASVFAQPTRRAGRCWRARGCRPARGPSSTRC